MSTSEPQKQNGKTRPMAVKETLMHATRGWVAEIYSASQVQGQLKVVWRTNKWHESCSLSCRIRKITSRMERLSSKWWMGESQMKLRSWQTRHPMLFMKIFKTATRIRFKLANSRTFNYKIFNKSTHANMGPSNLLQRICRKSQFCH